MQKGGAPYGTLRLLVSEPDPLVRGPAGEGAYSCGGYYDPVAADRHDLEVIATVLLPAGFVVLGANRALLAIAHEVEAGLLQCRGLRGYRLAEAARRWPRARLYSSEPRSSALPSIRILIPGFACR